MERWIWRNLQGDLPANWELLQYSKNPDAGVLAFADPAQFRLELNWQAGVSTLDTTRLVSDELARHRAAGEYQSLQARQHGEWQGWQGRGPDGWRSQWVRLLPEEALMLELVFLWPAKVEAATEQAVLPSLRAVAPAANGRRRWRAFGLDLLASPDLALDELRVEPAHAAFTFSAGEHKDRLEIFSRLGLVAHWLRGPVREWLAGKLPPKVREPRWVTHELAGHEVVAVRAAVPSVKFPRWGRGWATLTQAAWLCPRDGRLYHASCLTAEDDGTPATHLAGQRLACCAALEGLRP